MTTKTFDEMGKEELRATCKAAGVVGYGKLNNDGMRALLVKDAQDKMDAKAAAEAALKPAAATTVKDPTRKVQKDRPESNGVMRPSDDTICGAIWAFLDTVNATGTAPTTKDLATARDKFGWAKHTASTQLQRWREYNSLMPRRQKAE